MSFLAITKREAFFVSSSNVLECGGGVKGKLILYRITPIINNEWKFRSSLGKEGNFWRFQVSSCNENENECFSRLATRTNKYHTKNDNLQRCFSINISYGNSRRGKSWLSIWQFNYYILAAYGRTRDFRNDR